MIKLLSRRVSLSQVKNYIFYMSYVKNAQYKLHIIIYKSRFRAVKISL